MTRVSARERAAAQRSGFASTHINVGSYEMYDFTQSGVVTLDILPFKAGAGNPYWDPGMVGYERTYHAHGSLGPTGRDMFTCPYMASEKSSKRSPCPICQHLTEMRKDSDADPNLIKALKTRHRQLFIVRDPAWEEGVVRIMDKSFHLFGKLLNTVIKNLDESDEDEADFQYFADLETGYSLKIGVTEKPNPFGGKPFFEATTINFKKRKVQYSEEWLDVMPCLDDMVTVLPYAQLELQLEQEEAMEPEELPHTASAGRPAARPAAAAADDDDTPAKAPAPPKAAAPAKAPAPAASTSGAARKAPAPAAPKAKVAGDYGLRRDMAVLYKGEPCTIAKISPDGTSLTLLDAEDDVIKAVSVDEVLEGLADTGTPAASPAKAPKAPKAPKAASQAAPKSQPATTEDAAAGGADDWEDWN